MVFGAYLVTALAVAFLAVKGGNVTRHQRWMIRAFAVGIAIGTLRIWLGLFQFVGLLVIQDNAGTAWFGAAFWLSFPLHVLAAELYLSKRPCGPAAGRVRHSIGIVSDAPPRSLAAEWGSEPQSREKPMVVTPAPERPVTTRAADDEAVARNRRTVRAYEGYARNYALLVGPDPSPDGELSMRSLLAHVPLNGLILEVGSGTGHDADFLEASGVRVRRTDATQAFLDIQAERGRHAELLNVVTDELRGPYDGAVALCVLIHVEKSQLGQVLAKLRHALRPGRCLLLSMREGDGTEESGPWYTALWRHEDLQRHFDETALHVVWHHFHVDGDGDRWLTYVVQRPAHDAG